MHFKNLLIGLLAMAACCTATYSQTITAGGIVNAAGYRAPVAPGSMISVFGIQLASTAVAASTVPLPTTLGGVSVLVNGSLKAPLFYVSATQINAQLPYETPPGTATLAVGGSAAVSFTVAASAPGIIVYGSNRAVAINSDNSLNGADHPAAAGNWITVYMSGQGMVNPAVVTGEASPANPVALAVAKVTATLGGQVAEVLFAGLTPGAIGLFQVNLRVPALAWGDFPLVVTIGTAPSNGALVAVSSPGSLPPETVVRTMVYHQLTALPDSGPDYRTSTVISGNGAVIAYTRVPRSGPGQVYAMNFDGSGVQQVDSYSGQCSCGVTLDISDDGAKVVSTEQRQIRFIDRVKNAVIPLITVDTGVMGLKMEGDGRRVFFMLDRDGNIMSGSKWVPVQRGLYAINADGSGLRQIVGPNAVAALFGVTPDNYRIPSFTVAGNGPDHSLGVTSDGAKIVFGAQKVWGGGPDAIFGVNLDGSGLHMVLGPVAYVNHLAANSASASKVLYDTTSSSFVVETGVVNSDGSARLALRHDGLGNSPGVQLSADGSLLLAFDILYTTDGTSPLQLDIPYNTLMPGSPVMNATATRFVYPFVIPGTYSQGLSQLASLEINPASLGAAPSIVSPTISPAYVVAGGGGATLTAGISTANKVIGVDYAIMLNGLAEDPVNGDVFLADNGKQGDQTAGDGIYTTNNVVASVRATAGPRWLRVLAQVSDGAGMRHATLVDLSPFSVVLQAPAKVD